MKIQKKLIVCLGIAVFIGLVSSITSFSMKRPRTGTFLEESPDITQLKDIQHEISQKFQQFPMIQNAIQFLAGTPIVVLEQEGVSLLATNGNIVAAVSTDSEDFKIPHPENDSVKLWDISTGKQLIPTITHPELVDHVAMSGDIVVTGSRDGTVNISKTDGELLHTFKHPLRIGHIAIDANIIAIGSINEVQIFTINNHTINLFKIIKIDSMSSGWVKPAISDHVIAILKQDQNDENIVQVWDINSNKLLFEKKFQSYNNACFMEIETNGKVVAFTTARGDEDDTEPKVEIYDIETGKSLYALDSDRYPVDMAISKNKLAMESGDGIEIYNINNGTLLGTINTNARPKAIHDNIVITTAYSKKPQIWAIDPFKGTSENNPLVWIINNATVPQLDFIKRVYEATKDDEATEVVEWDESSSEEIINIDENKEFILTIPSEDAKVFLSFPMHVKQYLLTRLKIRR